MSHSCTSCEGQHVMNPDERDVVAKHNIIVFLHSEPCVQCCDCGEYGQDDFLPCKDLADSK